MHNVNRRNANRAYQRISDYGRELARHGVPIRQCRSIDDLLKATDRALRHSVCPETANDRTH